MQKMQRYSRRLLLPFIIFGFTLASGQSENELRGVWLAWAGANIPSKDRIADVMDKLLPLILIPFMLIVRYRA